jgi:hypothetical protein
MVEIWGDKRIKENILRACALTRKHKKEAGFLLFIEEKEAIWASKGFQFKVEVNLPVLGSQDQMEELRQETPGILNYNPGEGFWSPPFAIDLFIVHTHFHEKEENHPVLPSLHDLQSASARMKIAKKLSHPPFLWLPANGIVDAFREEIFVFRTPYPLSLGKAAQQVFREVYGRDCQTYDPADIDCALLLEWGPPPFLRPDKYWRRYERFLELTGIKFLRFPLEKWDEKISELDQTFPFLKKVQNQKFWLSEEVKI